MTEINLEQILKSQIEQDQSGLAIGTRAANTAVCLTALALTDIARQLEYMNNRAFPESAPDPEPGFVEARLEKAKAVLKSWDKLESNFWAGHGDDPRYNEVRQALKDFWRGE